MIEKKLTAEDLGLSIPDVSNYYNKSQVDALIPTVPTDISDLTDTEGLLNSEGGGLTKAQVLAVGLL